MRRVILVTMFVIAGLSAAHPVLAQSAIAGVVKDSSGGVLPGVTVEASSPALIEKIRTAATDATGQYKLIDLRPGTYTVTFNLSGFGTVKREGIELPAAFTATVNADLTVGSLAETLTVSVEAPIVDVQNSVQQSVISRKVLDTVPTGRNVFAVGALIPGTATNKPDVGGSEGMQQNNYAVHGSEARDIAFQVDGMSLNSNYQDGSFVGVYYNDGMIQEISYQTNALPAEVSQGGLRINMIPRDGGNAFHGAFFGSGEGHGMQSDNLTPALQARGLKLQNKVTDIYDINASLGGPILKDRLWFFTTVRRWGNDRTVANTVKPDGTPAVDDSHITDGVLRLTLQATPKNKISAYYDKNVKFRGHREGGASFVSPEAAIYQTTPLGYTSQIKWQSTVSSKLLAEAGVSLFYLHYTQGYEPEVKPTDVAKLDFVRSTLTNASLSDYNSIATKRNYTGSVSYVSGAHAFKTGVQFGEGPYRETYDIHGDITLRFRNGVPDSVDVFNTPTEVREALNAELGVYAQDSWTVRRATVNAGIRFEHFNTSVSEQAAPAGTFVPARSFAARPDTPNWNNTVPRLGVVYDLFGNGKTALRGSVSKYMENEGVGLADRVNPMYLASDRRSWIDTNHDGLAELDEIGPSTGFQGGSNLRVDPGVTRPYNWEYSGGLQQQLRAQLSVSVAYFRRNIRNEYGVKNQLVSAADYIPVTITNPFTNAPLTVYNQTPATAGRVDLLVSNYDELNRDYNGVEFKVDKRFHGGATLVGGLTVGKKFGSTLGVTSDLNNPNVRINDQGYVDLDSTRQLRLSGSYPLPLGMQVSGSLQSETGQASPRTYTVTRALIPSLTQVSFAVNVVPRGQVRLDPVNLLDVRLSKRFRAGGSRFELLADVYNVFNNSAVTGEVGAIGSSLGVPSSIVDGRLLRIGLKFDF